MKTISLIALAGLALSIRLAAADKDDKSGTNPLNFQQTLAFKSEFNSIGASYVDTTRLSYSYPLAPNFKAGLDLPLLATNITGRDKVGLSDMVLKATWIPYATQKMGVGLGADITVPSAAEDALGGGNWVFGPSVTVAFFLPGNIIFAPAYKHSASFAGSGGRAGVNTGTLDFYVVWRFDRNRQWLMLDPTILLDYENDRYESVTIRVAYGRVLGKVGNGAFSGYIRPGVGIGRHRPNDWSIEAGVSLVGF